MLAVYLNADAGKKPEVMEVEDDLQKFYELIDCEYIDIVNRKIGSKRFSIICDEEGLMKEDAKVSAIDNLGQPMLVGNLIIVSANNEDGELVGLAREEAEYVRARIKKMYTHKYPEGYYMLTQCEY